jgi:hypothetical protein
LVAVLSSIPVVDILKAQVKSVSYVEKIGTSETTGVEGVNVSRKLHLEDGSNFLWKPRSGEHISSWRYIPRKQLYRREKAAYLVDRILGFHMVPVVRIAKFDGDIGSLQEWIEDTSPADATLETYDSRDIWKAGLFDLIIGQTDRHSGNFLTKFNKPILIDNGFAFPSYAAKGDNRSLILSRFSYAIWDCPIPERYLHAIARLKQEKVKALLSKYLGPKTIALMYERIDDLLSRKKASIHKYKVIKKLDHVPKNHAPAVANISKSIDRLAKAKIYLRPGEKAPQGYQEVEGTRGGRYYESHRSNVAPQQQLIEQKREQDLSPDTKYKIKAFIDNCKSGKIPINKDDVEAYMAMSPDLFERIARGYSVQQLEEINKLIMHEAINSPNMELDERKLEFYRKYAGHEEDYQAKLKQEIDVRENARNAVCGDLYKSAVESNKLLIENDLNTQELLKEHKVIAEITDGSNLGKLKLEYENGAHAIYKPIDKECYDLRETVPQYTYALREACAYQIYKLFDCSFNLPPTVLWEENGEIKGTIQHWVEDGKDRYEYEVDSDFQQKFEAGIFDYLIGNTDRNGSNILYTTNKETGKSNINLIDNGLSFPSKVGELDSFLRNDAWPFRETDFGKEFIDKISSRKDDILSIVEKYCGSMAAKSTLSRLNVLMDRTRVQ